MKTLAEVVAYLKGAHAYESAAAVEEAAKELERLREAEKDWKDLFKSMAETVEMFEGK